jgi:hypothetical protein
MVRREGDTESTPKHGKEHKSIKDKTIRGGKRPVRGRRRETFRREMSWFLLFMCPSTTNLLEQLVLGNSLYTFYKKKEMLKVLPTKMLCMRSRCIAFAQQWKCVVSPSIDQCINMFSSKLRPKAMCNKKRVQVIIGGRPPHQ